jgi:soluble lytic murein transglycosylase-like protein
MNIQEAYLQVIAEDQVEEGLIKNAIGATLIAGAALGAYKASQDAPRPQKVISGTVQKFEPRPMNQDEATQKLVSHWNVHPNTAHQITQAAWKYGNTEHVTPHVLLGLMATESSFKFDARSKLKRDAAVGLMQVRPKMHGLKPTDFSTIDSQVKHGSELLKKFHTRMGNLKDGLTAYNNGVTATLRNRDNVNHDYAPKVMGNIKKFQI